MAPLIPHPVVTFDTARIIPSNRRSDLTPTCLASERWQRYPPPAPNPEGEGDR